MTKTEHSLHRRPKDLAIEKSKLLLKAVGIGLLAYLLRADSINTPPVCAPQPRPPAGFAYNEGGQLMIDGQPQRLTGPNIYWLGLDYQGLGYIYPSRQRIDNALEAAAEMNSNVVRTHMLISLGCSLCLESKIGVFNEKGFEAMDYVVKKARDLGLKLLTPFTDNWNYSHGGLHTFLRWRGRTNPVDFFADPQLRQDYKDYIAFILNHVNPLTGIAYKDDPTFLAFSTGNELTLDMHSVAIETAAADWTQDIVAFIKSIAPNTMIADGRSANYLRAGLPLDGLANCDIAMVSDHAYPIVPNWIRQDAALAALYSKIYLVEESGDVGLSMQFPMYPMATETEFYLMLLKGEIPQVAGVLPWSLFGSADGYGLVKHNDGLTSHFPDARTLGYRLFAYLFKNQEIKPLKTPDTPQPFFVNTEKGLAIAWQSILGSLYYRIETSDDEKTWTHLANVTDNDLPIVLHATPERIRVIAMNAEDLASLPSPAIQVP